MSAVPHSWRLLYVRAGSAHPYLFYSLFSASFACGVHVKRVALQLQGLGRSFLGHFSLRTVGIAG